jgi:hypothetical protein
MSDYPEPTITVHDGPVAYIGGGGSYALTPVTLTEFLLARIAEDEYDSQYARVLDGLDWGERLRAECEAKRRIVDAYVDERSRRDVYQSDESRAVEDEDQALRRRTSAARCRGLEIAVELLSRPYGDHPDYQQEWRP